MCLLHTGRLTFYSFRAPQICCEIAQIMIINIYSASLVCARSLTLSPARKHVSRFIDEIYVELTVTEKAETWFSSLFLRIATRNWWLFCPLHFDDLLVHAQRCQLKWNYRRTAILIYRSSWTCNAITFVYGELCLVCHVCRRRRRHSRDEQPTRHHPNIRLYEIFRFLCNSASQTIYLRDCYNLVDLTTVNATRNPSKTGRQHTISRPFRTHSRRLPKRGRKVK